MNAKVGKIAFLVMLALVLIAATVGEASAGNLETPRSFCQAWANEPYKSGSSIKGSGGATCSTSGTIKIVVEVRDRSVNPIQVGRVTKTCNNATSCSATASIPYDSGHSYDTVAPGKRGVWEGLWISDQVTFP